MQIMKQISELCSILASNEVHGEKWSREGGKGGLKGGHVAIWGSVVQKGLTEGSMAVSHVDTWKRAFQAETVSAPKKEPAQNTQRARCLQQKEAEGSRRRGQRLTEDQDVWVLEGHRLSSWVTWQVTGGFCEHRIGMIWRLCLYDHPGHCVQVAMRVVGADWEGRTEGETS